MSAVSTSVVRCIHLMYTVLAEELLKSKCRRVELFICVSWVYMDARGIKTVEKVPSVMVSHEPTQ